MKWRTTPFPWYDDMAEILGETQGTGRYSFQLVLRTPDPTKQTPTQLLTLRPRPVTTMMILRRILQWKLRPNDAIENRRNSSPLQTKNKRYLVDL